MTLEQYNKAVQADLAKLRNFSRTDAKTRKALLASVAQLCAGQKNFKVFGKTVTMRCAYRQAVRAIAAALTRKPTPRHPQGVERVKRFYAGAYISPNQALELEQDIGEEAFSRLVKQFVHYRADITEQEARELLHHEEYQLPVVESLTDRAETDATFDNRPTALRGDYNPNNVKPYAELAQDAPGQDFGHRDWAHNGASDYEVVAHDPITGRSRGHFDHHSLNMDVYEFSDGSPVPYAQQDIKELTSTLDYLNTERDSSRWVNTFIDGELVGRHRCWKDNPADLHADLPFSSMTLGPVHTCAPKPRYSKPGTLFGKRLRDLENAVFVSHKEEAERIELLVADDEEVQAHAELDALRGQPVYDPYAATVAEAYAATLPAKGKAPKGSIGQLAKLRLAATIYRDDGDEDEFSDTEEGWQREQRREAEAIVRAEQAELQTTETLPEGAPSAPGSADELILWWTEEYKKVDAVRGEAGFFAMFDLHQALLARTTTLDKDEMNKDSGTNWVTFYTLETPNGDKVLYTTGAEGPSTLNKF